MKKQTAVILVAMAMAAGQAGAWGSHGGDAAAAADGPAVLKGTVVEATNVAPYVYVLVDVGATQVWAAAPSMPVAVGESVEVSTSLPMAGFHSPSLNRTFDMIYFVGELKPDGDVAPGLSGEMPAGHPDVGAVMGGEMPAGHPEVGAAAGDGMPADHAGLMGFGHAAPAPAPLIDLDYSAVQVPEGGITVADLHSRQAELNGQEVVLQGRVAKFTEDAMSRNWIRLRDGTGESGESDELVVTTQETVTPGSRVTVRGTLAVEKDFGYGLVYPLVVEDAAVTVEE